MSKTISYSDAREHLKTYLDYTIQNNDPIFITRKNGGDAVLMSKNDYNSIEETLYLLSSEKNRKHLTKALSGKGKKNILKSKKDIEKLFAEL